MILYIFLCIILAVLFGGAYFAYRKAFYSPMEGRGETKPIVNPAYDPYREEMRRIYKVMEEGKAKKKVK